MKSKNVLMQTAVYSALLLYPYEGNSTKIIHKSRTPANIVSNCIDLFKKISSKQEIGADKNFRARPIISDYSEKSSVQIKRALNHKTSAIFRGVENAEDYIKRKADLRMEVFRTGKFYGRQSHPEYQFDKAYIVSLLENPKLLKRLKTEGFDSNIYIAKNYYRQGYEEAYRELLTKSSPKSDLLLDFLKGKGNYEATKILDEALTEMGHKQRYFLNPKNSNDFYREHAKSYDWGFYGVLADDILAFEKKIITEEQFKNQIKHVIGKHNFTAINRSSTFEYLVADFFDELDRGTRGGLLKDLIWNTNYLSDESDPFELVAHAFKNWNSQKRIFNLNNLKITVDNSGELTPGQKEILNDMIEQGIAKIQEYSKNVKELIRVDQTGGFTVYTEKERKRFERVQTWLDNHNKQHGKGPITFDDIEEPLLYKERPDFVNKNLVFMDPENSKYHWINLSVKEDEYLNFQDELQYMSGDLEKMKPNWDTNALSNYKDFQNFVFYWVDTKEKIIQLTERILTQIENQIGNPMTTIE